MINVEQINRGILNVRIETKNEFNLLPKGLKGVTGSETVPLGIVGKTFGHTFPLPVNVKTKESYILSGLTKKREIILFE